MRVVIRMIGYPNGKRKQTLSNKVAQKANLGQSLEQDLNATNDYYRVHNIALVHKKPTPITVVEVDYPKRSAAKITKAFYQLPSTTDYNGVYKGVYIDFEAKSTKNKTRLPLSMIHSHQLSHLDHVLKHQGFGFLILRFSVIEETYLVEYTILKKFLKETSLKSIPYEWIKSNGHLIPMSYLKPCDYIQVLDKILIKGE
jgi:recombination protein U